MIDMILSFQHRPSVDYMRVLREAKANPKPAEELARMELEKLRRGRILGRFIDVAVENMQVGHWRRDNACRAREERLEEMNSRLFRLALRLHWNAWIREEFAKSLMPLLDLSERACERVYGHNLRAADYARIFMDMRADELRLGREIRTGIELGMLVHDLGYAFIQFGIRTKTNLSEEDRMKLQEHPLLGAVVLEAIARNLEIPAGDAQVITNVAAGHHERCDGLGYPSRKRYPAEASGDMLPYEARIAALADTLDIITAWKRKRPIFPKADEALGMIDERGSDMFDFVTARIFTELWRKVGEGSVRHLLADIIRSGDGKPF